MLFVVYLPKNVQTKRDTLVATFLMEEDAKTFMEASYLGLEMKEIDAWLDWSGIRTKAFGENT